MTIYVTQGETPLHKAARHGHASVLLHLLSHAKQKITCDTRKQTPLDVAVKQDNDDVAMAIAGHPRYIKCKLCFCISKDSNTMNATLSAAEK